MGVIGITNESLALPLIFNTMRHVRWSVGGIWPSIDSMHLHDYGHMTTTQFIQIFSCAYCVQKCIILEWLN